MQPGRQVFAYHPDPLVSCEGLFQPAIRRGHRLEMPTPINTPTSSTLTGSMDAPFVGGYSISVDIERCRKNPGNLRVTRSLRHSLDVHTIRGLTPRAKGGPADDSVRSVSVYRQQFSARISEDLLVRPPNKIAF